MNTPTPVSPPASPRWMKAAEARRILGIPGRGLFKSELATGQLGLHARRMGKRGLLMISADSVERAAQRLAQEAA